MEKKESKSFREKLGIKKGKSGIKSKDDMKQMSEMEILSSIYAEREIKAAKERIDKKISKRDKKNKGLNSLRVPVSNERNYQYVRIIPEKGIINMMGLTESQFNDPNYVGYKEKYMVSAYTDVEGNKKLIKVASKGKFTKEEQEEYDRIMKAKKDLENKQSIFRGEEK